MRSSSERGDSYISPDRRLTSQLQQQQQHLSTGSIDGKEYTVHCIGSGSILSSSSASDLSFKLRSASDFSFIPFGKSPSRLLQYLRTDRKKVACIIVPQAQHSTTRPNTTPTLRARYHLPQSLPRSAAHENTELQLSRYILELHFIELKILRFT